MDHEAKKKYCRLLMFEIPSSSASPATPTSPSVFQATGELSVGYSPSQQAEACTLPSPPACSNDDLFVYEKGDGSFTPVLEDRQPQMLPRKRDRTLSIVTTPASPADTTDTAKEPSATVKKLAGQQEQRTPRPPNAFILYRRAVQPRIIAQHRNISNAEISKTLSHMWRDEPECVKLQWQREADRKKMEHAEAYPDYVYRPKKKSDAKAKKRRVRGVQQPNAYNTALAYPYFQHEHITAMLPSPPLTHAGSPTTPWSPLTQSPTTPGDFWPDQHAFSAVQHDPVSPCDSDNGGWEACGNPSAAEMYAGSFGGYPQDNQYMVHADYNYPDDGINDPSQHRQQIGQHDQQNQSHYQPHNQPPPPIDAFEELFGIQSFETLLSSPYGDFLEQ